MENIGIALSDKASTFTRCYGSKSEVLIYHIQNFQVKGTLLVMVDLFFKWLLITPTSFYVRTLLVSISSSAHFDEETYVIFSLSLHSKHQDAHLPPWDSLLYLLHDGYSLFSLLQQSPTLEYFSFKVVVYHSAKKHIRMEYHIPIYNEFNCFHAKQLVPIHTKWIL